SGTTKTSKLFFNNLEVFYFQQLFIFQSIPTSCFELYFSICSSNKVSSFFFFCYVPNHGEIRIPFDFTKIMNANREQKFVIFASAQGNRSCIEIKLFAYRNKLRVKRKFIFKDITPNFTLSTDMHNL